MSDVTVLDLPRVNTRVRADDEYVSMNPRPRRSGRTILEANAKRRQQYLEALREHVRENASQLALPVAPVIGRGQFESVPDDIRANVPPNTRTRRRV